LVGINAESDGVDMLSNIVITVNDFELVNESINQHEYMENFSLVKGVAESEVWKFTVEDVDGKSAEISLTLNREYELLSMTSAGLGAQDNTSIGSFYSFSLQEVLMQGDAFENQESVDLLYYFDGADENIIASPGANVSDDIFTGTSGLVNWTTLNETRYYKTSLATGDFTSLVNDGDIISNYVVADAKRKAKNLSEGDIYTFRTSSGRYGAFKVVTVTGAAEGSIDIEIKYVE